MFREYQISHDMPMNPCVLFSLTNPWEKDFKLLSTVDSRPAPANGHFCSSLLGKCLKETHWKGWFISLLRNFSSWIFDFLTTVRQSHLTFLLLKTFMATPKNGYHPFFPKKSPKSAAPAKKRPVCPNPIPWTTWKQWWVCLEHCAELPYRMVISYNLR